MSALSDLVDLDADRTELGRGYGFTEGPAWSVAEQALIFSDIPADRRYRWTGAGAPEVYVAPNAKGNGMVYERGGTYLVCESDTSVVSRFSGAGGREVVVSHFEGAELNSPNDVVTRSDDSIYFTDPSYGRWNDEFGVAREAELDFQGLFRCHRDGDELQLLASRDEFEQPNGLCFSPDESLLYVNDSPRCHIKVFAVAPDGSLGPSRLFFAGLGTGEVGSSTPDGMKCDERGNVWASGPGGIWVIDPDGRHLGTVPTAEFPGNLAWGGPDLRTLFVCCSTTVFALRTKVASAPLPCHEMTPRAEIARTAT
jgi:gluconolactonase